MFYFITFFFFFLFLRFPPFSYEAPGDCGEENLLLQLQKLFTQLSEKAATTGGITKSLGIRSGRFISGQNIYMAISQVKKNSYDLHNV